MLVRRYEVSGRNIAKWQAIVTYSQRRNLLRFSHDIKISGQLGMTKPLSKVRQNYYWPGLEQDVKIYVAGCDMSEN